MFLISDAVPLKDIDLDAVYRREKNKRKNASAFSFFTEGSHTVTVAIRYLLPLLQHLSHAIFTIYRF